LDTRVADLGRARSFVTDQPAERPRRCPRRGDRLPLRAQPRARQPRELNMTDPSDKRDAKDAARRERRRAYQRAWYEANRERISVQKAHRYATDPKFRADRLACAKKNRRQDDWIRWKYGLSQQDFERMLERQHGLCLMCWKKFTRTPCVDHSHGTRMVRALLCTNCNVGFGQFFENPEFLRRAADFAEFFAAHEQEILRGDPAALQEAGRLRTALLEVDISSLLPPEFITGRPDDAPGKPPPQTTPKARDPAPAAAAVRPGRASARRQAASGRALPGRKGGRRRSQRDQGSARPHRRQARDGGQRKR
jgi:hypothetical protein